jgi:DNA-directed RNA polymerase subunit RPC12/RpoP
MALINCAECNKEISDKAISCPNCGVPMNGTNNTNKVDKVEFDKIENTTTQKSEDLLKCPKCNSTQLTSNAKGFSGGKALVGAALVGGVGLLAGTIGSGNTMITCLKCGLKFKAGDYYKEKRKIDNEIRQNREFRNRSSESADLSGTVFVIISVILGIAAIALFVNGWIFFGIIFSLATLFFAAGAFLSFSEAERKRKRR